VLDPIGVNDYEDQCFIAGKAFDFYIPDRSLLLEVNGDFWHANPEIYDASDLISYPGGEVMAETVWQRDETKKDVAKDRGYDVVYVWEREMEQDINSVRERVKSLL